ncbi:MAG: hypothetical protein SFW63_04860 [Alphaproteobacteria bacterium]|nr:hypothetical protein [Alphaproteobacteria bacterium]
MAEAYARELVQPYTYKVNQSPEENNRQIFRRPFLINKKVFFDRFEPRETIKPNDIYLGVAGFNSLDLICKQSKNKEHYQQAALFDINRSQLCAMNEVLDAVKLCDTADEFIKKYIHINSKYRKDPEHNSERPESMEFKNAWDEEKKLYHEVLGAAKPEYQPQGGPELKEYLKSLGKNESSWLHPDNFRLIKELVKNEKIKLFTLDLRDENRFGHLREWLKKSHLVVGDMYISSIRSFMDPALRTDYHSKSSGNKLKDAQSFYDDLLSLAQDGTRFLSSEPNRDQSCLQDYYVTAMSKKNMQEYRNSLRNIKPQNEKHDYQFEAGGMTWRMLSVAAGEPGDAPPRYFRIFADKPSPKSKLPQAREMRDRIQKIIDEFNVGREGTQKLLLSDQQIVDDDVKKLVNERTPVQIYSYDQEQIKKANSGKTGYLSTKPFAIDMKRQPQNIEDRDPAKLLKEIELKIKNELDKAKPEQAFSESAPAARDIKVNRSAIDSLLNRSGAAPIDAIRGAGRRGRSGGAAPGIS